MKTSLNILRATNACTGGFGRQASFWTVRPKAKAIEYPIWMVGLIGNYDDMSWAINNSLIVNEAEFSDLKIRTFWPMFQSILWSALNADMILKLAQKKQGDFVRDALQDVLKVKDAAEAKAWMDKYQRFKINHSLFANVANHAAWTDAQQYLAHLMENITLEKSELCLEHEQAPFDLDVRLPGHDSRTMKPIKAAVRRAPTRRRYEDEDDEEPSSKKAEKVDPTKSYYFDLPKGNGRVVTKGESFAYVLLNEDPWPAALQFMLDNNVPKVIGSKVNLSKVSPDGVKPPQFAASLHLNDPRTIFTLIHLLQGQDFDLLKAIGFEQQGNQLRRVLMNYGTGDRLEDLDQIVDNEDGDWKEAQERIVESMENARSSIALNGPTNNAVRERQIAAPRDTAAGDESWDTPVATADAEEEDDEA